MVAVDLSRILCKEVMKKVFLSSRLTVMMMKERIVANKRDLVTALGKHGRQMIPRLRHNLTLSHRATTPPQSGRKKEMSFSLAFKGVGFSGLCEVRLV